MWQRTPNIWHKSSDTKAFTLLEMSIVLVIIATFLGGGMATFLAYVQKKGYENTEERLHKIEAALVNYRNVFNRLPCPGDITLAVETANYGREADTKGTCTGGSLNANFSSGNMVEGAVPTKTLNLPDEYEFDSWGRRIRYMVDKRYTEEQAFLTYSDFNANNATYVLISHGANGHGAYPRDGGSSMINADSTNTREQNNCACTSTATAGTFAGLYEQGAPTQSTTDPNNKFDDIVISKKLVLLGVGKTCNYFSPTNKSCSYVTFDGVNDYIQNTTMPTSGTGDVSYSFWVSPSIVNGSNHSIIYRGRGGGGGWHQVNLHSTNKFIGYIDGGNADLGTTVATANTWYHVVYVYTGGVATLYINNVSEVSNSRTIATSATGFTLGTYNVGPTYCYGGKLADVRVYNKALSTDEINFLYTAGTAGTNPGTSNLQLWYKFNEGSGTAVGDSAGSYTGTATNITASTFWSNN